MTWEPRRLPNLTPETERFWKAAGDQTLLLRNCESCGLTYHYPRNHCPDCLSDDVIWQEAEGTGEVYSYSVTEQVSDPPVDELPLVVAYVELTEGPRLLTNIVDCDPDAVTVGLDVSVDFRQSQDGSLGIPVFSPR